MRLAAERMRGQTIRKLTEHSPLVDRLDSIGGILATVHVAVLSAERAMAEESGGAGPEKRLKASLVKEHALRRLREDLPYLLLSLGSSSPEREEALEGLRLIRNDPGSGHAGVLSGRILAEAGAGAGQALAAPKTDPILKVLEGVESAEQALRDEMDPFEEGRRKLARHRAYESLEALLPEILLSLDSDPLDGCAIRALDLLRRRVTPLVRPAAVLAGIVLERLNQAVSLPPPGQELSVDLA